MAALVVYNAGVVVRGGHQRP